MAYFNTLLQNIPAETDESQGRPHGSLPPGRESNPGPPICEAVVITMELVEMFDIQSSGSPSLLDRFLVYLTTLFN